MILIPQTDEIEILLDNLSSRGLHMVISAENREEADYIMNMIKKHSKDHMI